MELVLVVAVVALLALVVREHLAARAAQQRNDAVVGALRAEVAAAEERAERAEHHERELEQAASSAAVGRAHAEAELARGVAAADARAGEAEQRADEAEHRAEVARQRADDAEAARERTGADAERRVAEAGERAAGAEAAAAEAATRVVELERRLAAAEEAGRRAEAARRAADEQASAARAAAVDAETTLAKALDGGADAALAHALWAAELSRIERAWRAAIAPMAPAGALAGESTGALLTTAVAHELERAREEVGISTEVSGRLDGELQPIVALVALRAVQELVAETIRCCNSVDVAFDDADGVAVTVSGEGATGGVPDTARVGGLVAVAAGEVSSQVEGGSVTTRLAFPAPASDDDAERRA